jgi:RNA polymerase sigma factor (sigma-70 family)
MLHDDLHERIRCFAERYVRRKAQQMSRRPGFTDADREDLAQELFLLLLRRRAAFDPAKAHAHAFTATVVERGAASLLRDRRAEKRDARRVTSLHQFVDTDGGGRVEIAAAVGRREYDARRGQYPRGEEELAQLASDLADVLATLPPDLRHLAEQLQTKSLAEVARAQGVQRTTLYEQVRRLRRRFERAGLKDYL